MRTAWAAGGLWLFQVGVCELFVVSMYCLSPLAISIQLGGELLLLYPQGKQR